MTNSRMNMGIPLPDEEMIIDLTHVPHSEEEDNQTTRTMLHECAMHVTGYIQTSRGHWVYEIEISDPSGHSQQYILRKRYREFQRLYTHVCHLGPALPAFPRAGVWSYLQSSNVRLLDERRRVFDQILTRMTATPVIRASQAFIDFVGIQPFSKRQSGYVSLGSYGTMLGDSELDKLHFNHHWKKKKNDSQNPATHGSLTHLSTSTASSSSNSQYLRLDEDLFIHPRERQESSKWMKSQPHKIDVDDDDDDAGDDEMRLTVPLQPSFRSSSRFDQNDISM